MNKKIPLIISIIIGLLLVYFSYKGLNLFYYNVDRITTQDFETFVKQFNISNTLTIKHKDLPSNDYFTYKNIKIRNDFKNYVQLSSSTQNTSPKLILKDEKTKTTKAFWMGEADTFVYMLKTDKTMFGTGDKRITSVNLKDMLEKNNIDNDIELFNYLAKQKYVKNNIFTSVKKMKEDYAIQFMISVIMPTMDSITLIDGDLTGYIFNLPNNMKEVSILKNDKRYCFVFMNKTDMTDEYLKNILSTIVID